MSDLMKRMMSSVKKDDTIQILNKSTFMTEKTFTPTPVAMINVALSAKVDGGMKSGLTVIAGPSKHFKSNFGLLLMAAYLKAYPEATALFVDSEFGASLEYFEAFGIDTGRVLHVPVANIEEMKFKVIPIVNDLKRGDKVFCFVDSVGNLASIKEVEDALNAKSVADMTRAKQLKSFFRIVTPMLTTKDIPMVTIAHTYDTQEMYSKKVVSGGTGIYYSADTIWIVGRRQQKDGTEVSGYDFMINIEKSRFVKEKAVIPVTVTYGGGIDKYSGLLDVALLTGHVIKPKQGWYARVIPDPDTGEMKEDKSWRKKDTSSDEFWDDLFEHTDFAAKLHDIYALSSGEFFDSSKAVELEELADELVDDLDEDDE